MKFAFQQEEKMYRTELLQELRNKYPFGKSASIVQTATDNGFFENDDVLIVVNREDADDYYQCDLKWK